MKICAVIAEFNPFHNGHKYLLEKLRDSGFTHIAVIMSGNFVQRGEPAIIPKRNRAYTALCSGADLIIEMPCIWAVSSAERYASAGIYIADALGCANSVAFGSECGNIEDLQKICDSLNHTEFTEILKKYVNSGENFAKARQKAIAAFLKDEKLSAILSKPNNILGVEYLKVIKKFDAKLEVRTIQRNKSPEFMSASEIRNLIKNNNDDYIKFVPGISAKEIERCIKNNTSPMDIEWGEKAILSALHSMDINDISALPNINEGLENRIFNCVQKAESLEDLFQNIKTKRYTMSRIKRIIISAFLGITEEAQIKLPPYLKILGTNKKGLEILKHAKKNSKLPIISRYSDINTLDEFSKYTFGVEDKSTKLLGAFTKKYHRFESEKTFKIITID